MKKFGLGILAILMCCGLMAFQVGAADIPKAMEGVDLGSAEKISDIEALNVKGQIQCTTYVANLTGYDTNKKTKVLNYRDGKYWNDDAKAAGYKVACTPSNNSIMVMEKWGTNSHGHVAYVKSTGERSFYNNKPQNDWMWSNMKITHANWDKRGNIFNHNAAYRHFRSDHDKGKHKNLAGSNSVGNVKINYGASSYPVGGFLTRK